MRVNTGPAQPTGMILDLDPAAATFGLGARPMAMAGVGLVDNDTEQALDVPGLDKTATVPATDRDIGDDVHRQEMSPASIDHRQDRILTDPPTPILGLGDQTTLETPVVPGKEPPLDFRSTTALALVRLHTSILTRHCPRVKY